MRGIKMKMEELAVHDKAIEEVKEAIQAGSDLAYDFLPGRLADSDEAWPLILNFAEIVLAQKERVLQRQYMQNSQKINAEQMAVLDEAVRVMTQVTSC